ncbi:unnamed protein product [Miscanthus lutarioriparius]|uniref:Peroxidase n=1 Tax=Miscanthus lutarioriparius TaxID=422564 RepID=A0A811SS22_9POAL|nr:unnamed protein product [Miscanthus lutarioriparius]
MRTSGGGFAGLVVCVATVCLLLPTASRAQLKVGFYNTTCPNAEALVRQGRHGCFRQQLRRRTRAHPPPFP